MSGNYGEIVGFTITKLEKGTSIVWEMEIDNFNLFDYLPVHLKSIIDNKKQFKDYEQNILFIGANQIPVNHLFGMFREMASPDRFREEVIELSEILTQMLPKEIMGVCYFHYSLHSLPQIHPYYPLKIFWKNGIQLPKIEV